MNRKEFLFNLPLSKNEKDVENCYRAYLNSEVGKMAQKDKNIGTIVSPYGTDGHFKYKNPQYKIDINCLFEFKYNTDLLNKSDVAKILIQVLYYLKKFQLGGNIYIPTTIMVGDINECFIIHSSFISKYLDRKLNWSIAPSQAAYDASNNDLLMDMIKDETINPHIIKIDENFNGIDVLKYINLLSKDIKTKIKITPQNVHIIFRSFEEKVFGKDLLGPNESVNLFVQCLIDRENNYIQPMKKNTLVTKSFGERKVNSDRYNSFMNYFESDLSPVEKETLTSIQDRLIQDETRRRKGEFFTPTPWVNEAHRMISEAFGEDWKEKYIVWDPAAGTANLTRDYKFKELYISTINQSDIDTIEQMGYNPGSVKFQYDFLNDGIVDGKIDVAGDEKLPDGLKKAILEGKDIIVFMNPPYGSVQSFDNIHQDGGQSRNKIEDTFIKQLMNEDKMGLSVKNLYSQFLYRLYKIKEQHDSKINIGLYSPPLFLTGSDFKPFREKFLNRFSYKDGMLFNASNFNDVSNWGLSFTIFSNYGENIKNEFILKIKEDINFEITTIEEKSFYNLDCSIGCNEWVRKEIKGIKATLDMPKMSSALEVKQEGYSNLVPNAIGYFYSNGNNVYYNNINVAIFSSCFSGKSGISIVKENLFKCLSNFTARKSIQSNWINQKDEYMAPNTEHPDYKQFNNDAIVYSLFNTSSNQSSMRQVSYKDKLWDIKNEFFWMSKDEMMELSEKYHFDEMYKDAKNSEDRYVYNILKDIDLSPDAKELLELSKELVRKSFEWRKIMNDEHPEYFLFTWDCGFYQLKKVLSEYFKKDLVEFSLRYKAMEARMRPLIFELGFLKNLDHTEKIALPLSVVKSAMLELISKIKER